jgi:hypothetical protein
MGGTVSASYAWFTMLENNMKLRTQTKTRERSKAQTKSKNRKENQPNSFHAHNRLKPNDTELNFIILALCT